MGKCLHCPPGANYVEDERLLDHLRLMHPTEYGDGPERWPDGEPVVEDTTLEPENFE